MSATPSRAGSPVTSVAIAMKSWRDAFVGGADGFRVWRSFRNWKNQFGNGSISGASVFASPRTDVAHRQRSGSRYLGQAYAGVGQKRGLNPLPPRGIPEVLPLRVMP